MHRATDAKTARSIEATLRAELAEGNWGILERKPAPTLKGISDEGFFAIHSHEVCGQSACSISSFSLALLSEGRFVSGWPFQRPQMQNRRAKVPFRHISPLIEGSLGD
jgi:hypothetical protein